MALIGLRILAWFITVAETAQGREHTVTGRVRPAGRLLPGRHDNPGPQEYQAQGSGGRGYPLADPGHFETGCQYLLAKGDRQIRHFRIRRGYQSWITSLTFWEDRTCSRPTCRRRNTRGQTTCRYDRSISYYWRNEAIEYAEGRKTREQAITDFKEYVDQYLGYYARGKRIGTNPSNQEDNGTAAPTGRLLHARSRKQLSIMLQ